jgi:hypothetical protein
MSEATRAAALLHAANVHGADGHESVLEAAKKFNAFLEGGTATADKPAATAKPAAKPAATAKPAAKPATKKAVVEDDDEGGEEAVVTKATKKAAAAVEEEEESEDGGEEVTAEQVETVIADLLGANLRKQAVALLGEYGAKSASGVKAGDRVAFYEQAQTLLLGS